MRARIWTASGRTGTKCIFNGDLEYIPRVGEGIAMNDDLASEEVSSVTLILSEMSVEIRIKSADEGGLYTAVPWK